MNKKVIKSKNSIALYSFTLVMVLALMMVFSGTMYGSYKLSQVLAEDNSSVLSDDDEREGSNEGPEEEDDSDEDEADDIDEDDSEDSDELEDEEELEDEDGIDDDDSLKDELENFVESQKDLQEESIDQLEKISERSGVVKFLVGPNFESIKKLQEVIDANTRMLQQIQQVRSQALTPEEQQALDTLSSSIENQNEVINTQLGEQEGRFSLFGWLVRLLSRD